MSYLKGVQCIRCGHPLGDNAYFTGCPVCHEQGINVNYTTVYDLKGAKLPARDNGQPGMYRFREFMPLDADAVPVSIGEGNTPLIKLNRLGERLGIKNLYVKDESRNPTLSYKDRLCSLVVSRALHEKAPAVTISSTGNHGAAAAAYSAAAGLPCVIFTVPEVPQTMKTLMQALGACVIVTPTPRDRWTIMEKCVRELGWMPASGFMSPPIGSNCFGIDGYKPIAFETYEQLGNQSADMMIVPACYADGLYGSYKGWCDLKEMGYIEKIPKMVASEVYGPITHMMETKCDKPEAVPTTDWTVSFSISASTCTWQGVEAVRGSEGYARTSNDTETMEMQKLLGFTEGIYAEASSVTTLVAAAKLAKENKISDTDKVVAVLTSTGLKDPASTQKHLPDVPVIQPQMDELRAALKGAYGIQI